MTSTKELFYDWMGLNVWLFKQINSISGSFYDSAMLTITELGNKHFLPHVIIAIVGYIVISYIIRLVQKKGGNKYYLSLWLGVLLVMIAGFATAYTNNKFLKNHFAYERPYAALPEGEVRQLEFREPEDATRSFPSGHVTFITIIVMALWPTLKDKGKMLGLGLIFAVAWSRMALGVHFPADVLGAFLLTTFQIIILRSIIYTLLRKVFSIKC